MAIKAVASSLQKEPPKSLLGFLVEQKILSFDQKMIVLREAEKTKRPIEEILPLLGFIDLKTLGYCLAFCENLSPFNPEETPPDPSISARMSRKECEVYQAVPLSFSENGLNLAICDAVNLPAHAFFKERFSCETIIPFLIDPSEFHKLLNTLFPPASSLKEILMPLEKFQQGIRDENHCASFLDALIKEAVDQGASDIHFEPEGVFVRVRIRLDGVLWQRVVFHQEFWPPLSVRLKILADLDIAESRLPQNGRFSQKISGRAVDFRLSFHPTVHGENAVLRILDKHHSLIPLDRLGYTQDQYDTLLNLVREPQGLVIFTGPTGSGKSTSLYSLLQELNEESVNIMTLEDPVEFDLPLVRQTEVREPGGVSFAKGIRSILRQDPDVILVAEIRDEETAQMAFRAAVTGHLVLSTLHTIDALGALYRLEDLGLNPNKLAGVIRGLVAQRLIRKKCPLCREGCESCDGRSYRGRQALAEILIPDAEFERMLSDGSSYAAFRVWCQKTKTQTLKDHAKELLEKKVTDKKEILRVLGRGYDDLS